jgi:hypothetical protein
MKMISKNYEIGYCKTPKHSRWKNGQCGNPDRIRKRSVKPVVELIDAFFTREVEVVDDGISQRRTAFETIYLQLCNKAMAGNTRALNVLTKYNGFAARSRLLGRYRKRGN